MRGSNKKKNTEPRSGVGKFEGKINLLANHLKVYRARDIKNTKAK